MRRIMVMMMMNIMMMMMMMKMILRKVNTPFFTEKALWVEEG